MDLFNNREAHFWRNTFTRLALVMIAELSCSMTWASLGCMARL